MNANWFFYALSALFMLSSCGSMQDIVDDDVYIIGKGKLPVGESLNDETGYANYREERIKENEPDYFSANGPLYYPSYSFYPIYSSWGYPYQWNGVYMGYGYAWGYNYGWNSCGMNYYDPYFGYYNPYGNCYNSYMYPYGYGYGYQSYYHSNPQPIAIHSAVHYGPRGSWVSTNNPANRPSSANGLLKSMNGQMGNNPTVSKINDRQFRSKDSGLSTVKNNPQQRKSPLIHQEQSREWSHTNQQLINRSIGNELNHPTNRNQFPSQRTNRTEVGNRAVPTRQAPTNRPTRPSPTPGRRL